MRCSILVVTVLALSNGAATIAYAQNDRAVERIGRDRPMLVPTSDGPRARINELRFVEHGGRTWLLAASSDKAVHRWEVSEEAGLVPAAPLRWPIFRGLRGSIYTLADLGHGVIAVAGVGVKSSQVSLLHLEGNTPPRRLVDATQARQNVWALSADASRQLLYVGEGTGVSGTANLLMWSLRDAEPKITCCATKLSDVKHVAVSPDGTHVVAAGPLADRKSWGFYVWSTGSLFQRARSPRSGGAVAIAPVQEATFTSQWPDSIRGVDWLDSSTWIAATVLGYAHGTLKGTVDKAGFEAAMPDKWQAGFLIRRGEAGRFGVSNTNPLPITLLDTATNRRVTLDEGDRETFGADARIRRLRDNEESLGPWSGTDFAGWDIAFVPYVVDLDCAPKSKSVLSSIWNDGRAIAVLEQRGPDGVVGGRTPLRPAFFRDVTAMALSPDGRFAAATGPELITVDDREVAVQHVRVWSTDTGKLVAKFPDGDAPAVGGPIASIVTSRRGPRDTIVYQYGNLPNLAKDYFRIYPGIVDAQEPVPSADADLAFAAKESRSFPNGHRVKRVPGEIDVLDGSYRETIGGRGVPVVRFFMSNRAGSEDLGPFFTTPENLPNCCVTFTSNGRAYAAVGLADGIQVWDLAECRAGRGYRALARWFYGHDANVMSIDVSTDGAQLYSGSVDGTLCGWSLRDLDRTGELGIDTNATSITGVTPRCCGYYAGFETGMTVTELQIQGRPVPANRLADCLRDPLPGLEYFFTVRTAKDTIKLQTPVAHDPLWTYFPRHDGQSVMWTPEGYFDTNEALNSTETIEWVVNLVGPLGQSDEVVVLAGVDRDGSKFRDTGVLDDVFLETLRAEDGIPAPPAITLEGNARGCEFSSRPIGGDQHVTGLELHFNGKLLQRTNGAPIRLDGSAFESAIRSGTNTFAGVVETTVRNATTGRDETFVFRRLVGFERSDSPPPRRMHFVGVAVENAPRMDKLPTVVADVSLVGDAVRANRTALARRRHPVLSFAETGTFELLVGTGDDDRREPTAANVRDALGTLASGAAPDDLAIIVLSSHGELNDGKYVFYTTDELIPQDELIGMIQRLPCRTLLILDTCHSGAGVGEQRQIAQFARVVNGPMVLTACGPNEVANFDRATLKHGFFLAAVAEAFKGERIAEPRLGSDESIDDVDTVADADADGWLSVAELARYVQQRTAVFKTEYDPNRSTQSPQVVSSVFFTDSARTPLR